MSLRTLCSEHYPIFVCVFLNFYFGDWSLSIHFYQYPNTPHTFHRVTLFFSWGSLRWKMYLFFRSETWAKTKCWGPRQRFWLFWYRINTTLVAAEVMELWAVLSWYLRIVHIFLNAVKSLFSTCGELRMDSDWIFVGK